MLDADVSFEAECAAIQAYPMSRGIMGDFRFPWRAANSNDFVLAHTRPCVRRPRVRAICDSAPLVSRIGDPENPARLSQEIGRRAFIFKLIPRAPRDRR